MFCIHYSIDYESKLLSFVDSPERVDWPEEYPQTILTNKLYRLMKNDDILVKNVYDNITSNFSPKAENVCKSLQDKLNISSPKIKTLQDLVKIHGKRSIISLLIYDRKWVSFDTIRDILANLEDDVYEAENNPTINTKKLSFDSCFYVDIFMVLSKYLTIADLIRVSITSKHWHTSIMKKSFASNAQSFRTFTFTTKGLLSWNILYSTQWYLNNLTVLHINISNNQLKTMQFPEFQQQNIQYLDTHAFHCVKPLTKLKSLKIWGNNERIRRDFVSKWTLQKNYNILLRFIVIHNVNFNYNDHLYIPLAQSILFNKCPLRSTVIYNWITNDKVDCVTLQQCYLSRYHSMYLPPLTDSDICEHIPNTTFNLLYVESITKIWYILSSGSMYDKYISKLQLLLYYDDIIDDWADFCAFLTKFKNTNKPKEIGVFLHHDGPASDVWDSIYFHCNKRDKIIWDWLKGNDSKIKSNSNVKHFFVGIIRTFGEEKRSYCFDIKTMDVTQYLNHQLCWDSVLYDNTDVDDNNVVWNNQFNKIIDSV